MRSLFEVFEPDRLDSTGTIGIGYFVAHHTAFTECLQKLRKLAMLVSVGLDRKATACVAIYERPGLSSIRGGPAETAVEEGIYTQVLTLA